MALSLLFISPMNYSQTIPAKEDLQIGIGVVDISGDSAIILDPLHVKAVVLKQGTKKIALVECDIIRVSNEWTDPVRKLVSGKTGIAYEDICIAATHNHMGIPYKDLQPAIIKAVADALAGLKAVKLRSAVGQQFNVSFNRRYFMKDGSVVFNPMFLNADIVRPAGPIDADVGFVLFNDAASGKSTTAFINFPLHPDIVKEYGAVYQQAGTGSRNSVSADYPYWIETALRKDFGNTFNSMFFLGCCGNINHWNFSKPGPQSGHKTKSKEVGDSLYNSIRRALPLAREETPSLASRSRVLKVPLQSITADDVAWAKALDVSSLSGNSEEPAERKKFLDNVKRTRILFLDELKQKGIVSLPLDVQVFRLSDNTAIVTLPGEFFVEFGLMIKNLSPFDNTIIVEMANNGVNYVPTKKAFLQGGYEVENSRLAPGGGEMLAEAAVQMLKDLKNDAQ
jgi:hypothetical protein